MKKFHRQHYKKIQKIFEEKTGVLLTPEQASESRTSAWVAAPQWKPLRVAVLVLVIASLMGIAAFAVSVAKREGNRKYEAKIEGSYDAAIATDEWGNSETGRVYELSLSLPISANAPEMIEDYYLLQIPECYPLSDGNAYGPINYEGIGKIQVWWDVPDRAKMGITFSQESVSGMEYYPFVKHNVFAKSEPVIIEAVYGGFKGFLFSEVDGTDFPRKWFYWSDGEYVFKLQVPYDFTDEQMNAILGSLHKVTTEELRPYLVSMTNEEFEEAFSSSD